MTTAHALYQLKEKFIPGTKCKRKERVALVKTDAGG